MKSDKVIVGIDEVGRGCWAGPLVAAAIILKSEIKDLTDSKLLSSAARTLLSEQIHQEAAAVGVGWVAPAFIDMYGLTLSVQRAMQQALSAIKTPYQTIIIDGNYNYLPNEPTATFLVKADLTVPAVSAASIVAKVARDNFMAMAAKSFPEYGFERHVGYGTAMHLAKLRQYGICDLHRKSVKPVRALLKLKAEEQAMQLQDRFKNVND